MNFNNNLIGIEMLTDEENLLLFLQYGSSPLSVSRQPVGRSVFQQKESPRGSRSEPYFGSYVSDPRPTKAEGRKALEKITRPIRVITPFVPPHPFFQVPVRFAPKGAQVLIELDPLDKFRD